MDNNNMELYLGKAFSDLTLDNQLSKHLTTDLFNIIKAKDDSKYELSFDKLINIPNYTSDTLDYILGINPECSLNNRPNIICIYIKDIKQYLWLLESDWNNSHNIK